MKKLVIVLSVILALLLGFLALRHFGVVPRNFPAAATVSAPVSEPEPASEEAEDRFTPDPPADSE